jgi:hypothetical protein
MDWKCDVPESNVAQICTTGNLLSGLRLCHLDSNGSTGITDHIDSRNLCGTLSRIVNSRINDQGDRAGAIASFSILLRRTTYVIQIVISAFLG